MKPIENKLTKKHPKYPRELSLDEWFSLLSDYNLTGVQTGNSEMMIRFNGQEIWTYSTEEKEPQWRLDIAQTVNEWYADLKTDEYSPMYARKYWIVDEEEYINPTHKNIDIEHIIDMM